MMNTIYERYTQAHHELDQHFYGSLPTEKNRISYLEAKLDLLEGLVLDLLAKLEDDNR